jgi:hypothetical protein
MLALMFVLCRYWLPLVQCGGGGVPNALPVVLIMEFMETFAKPGVGATHQPWVADLGGGSGALSMAAKMIGCNAMTIDSDAGLAKIVHESWQAVSIIEAWLHAIQEVTPKNAPQLTLLADAPASEQERRVEGSTSSPAEVRLQLTSRFDELHAGRAQLAELPTPKNKRTADAAALENGDLAAGDGSPSPAARRTSRRISKSPAESGDNGEPRR